MHGLLLWNVFYFFLYTCICSIISLYYTSFGKINETFCRRLFIRKKLNNTIFEKTYTTFFRHIGKLCVFFSIILIILCYTLSLYIYIMYQSSFITNLHKVDISLNVLIISIFLRLEGGKWNRYSVENIVWNVWEISMIIKMFKNLRIIYLMQTEPNVSCVLISLTTVYNHTYNITGLFCFFRIKETNRIISIIYDLRNIDFKRIINCDL